MCSFAIYAHICVSASEPAFSDANSAEFITVEEGQLQTHAFGPSTHTWIVPVALLPPPFLSTQRRARAQSQALPPRAPLSPQVLRTPARRTLGVLNTPPPARSTAQRFANRCFTDPPQPRKRPSFGHVSTLFSI